MSDDLPPDELAALLEARGYRLACDALDALMGVPGITRESTAGVLLAGLAAALDDYRQMKWPLGEPAAVGALRREQEDAADAAEYHRVKAEPGEPLPFEPAKLTGGEDK